MNTVCPGFVPHHVKPNRCRRCFKDIQDHNSSNEVTTSFTLPLPRRRRESVAITETPKTTEEPSTSYATDQSATFTITETTSLGRRTRQRSSSTSSWFQEKKVNDEHKEKTESLFRNADDSRASYRSTDDGVDTVAVIRLPESRSRRKDQDADRTRQESDRTKVEARLSAIESSKSSDSKSPLFGKSSVTSKDDAKPPELPPKTASDKLDFTKKTTETPKSAEKRELESRWSARFGSSKTSDSEPLGRSSSFRSKLEPKDPEPVGRSSSFRSKLEPQTPETESSAKVPEKKPLESKFNERRPSETKFGEVKLRDTKLSEIRSRASKFDAPSSKFESAASKFDKPSPFDSKLKSTYLKTTDTKPDKIADTKIKDDNVEPSKLTDTKSKETTTESKDSKTEISKSLDSRLKDSKTEPPKLDKLKEAPKPVLSRFSNLKSAEPVATVKPSPLKKKVPSSSSEEESESEKTKAKSAIAPKEPDKKSSTSLSSSVTAVSKAKTETVKEEIPSNQSTYKFQKDQENKLKELQDSLDQLKKQLKTKEDTVQKLEKEKSELQRRQQAILDKDKEALEKTALELTKMRTKLTEMQNSQDDVKGENRKLKQELKDKEKDLKDRQLELKDSKQELSKVKQELMEDVKTENKKLKQELKDIKTELIQTSQDDVKSENRKLKMELREKEKELKDIKESLQNSQEDIKSENRKLKQELKDKEKDLKDKEKDLKEKEKDLKEKEKELKDKDNKLKDSLKELKDSKQELNKAKQELTKDLGQKMAPKGYSDQLKIKLAQSESLCEELAEENEEIKKEVRDLEQELEELHDNFREDQASEFRGLKKELETANKNCRVLQFKLRKAEKKCELLELDRHSLDDKVREYQAAVRQDVDRSKLKELEKELSLSRNIATSLGKEAKELKEALNRAEADNEQLRQVPPGARSATPTSQSRLSPAVSRDYDTLSHELSDTMERENDLREQLKFSEEEAKQQRRKIGALEQENETLVMQIKKLTHIVRNRTGKDDDAEEEEDLSAESMKLQLDLQEQELGVIRRKLEETEKDNENLQAEVKYLQDKLINQPLIELPDPPKDAGSAGAYWENKVRLQEYEMREIRRRVIEKDREIERLNTEVEIYRKKASKMMVRSRSLDSEIQVDLKRQLQLVEQEANMLRQKVNSLETDNEKLTTENKRMTLRLTKKPPPSSADILQMDNMELKQKLEDLQRKLEATKTELEKATSENPIVIQDYKPRRESLTSLSENESDLIASLKKRLKTKDEEYQGVQAKLTQLEIENGRLGREYKKLKDSLSSKKKPMKAIRDSATRVELRELVSELQDEISELHVNLRSREVVQEDLEDELEKAKKALREALKELKTKEERLQMELDKGTHERDTLRKEIDIQKSRATAAEDQLTQLSRQKPNTSALENSRKLSSLTSEKDDAERRAKAAEEQLEKKTQRLRETQEKLNATAALKEDMARSNRQLEQHKHELEKEVEDHRSLLVKAEAKAAELRSQVDKTDRDLTSLRKECNQLRNELEDERSRLKQSSDRRQTEVNSSWTREREDLRRTINELKNRIEQLQNSVTDNEKMFIEKESRLRDEFKRKRESAVRDAREKGEAALELAREDEKILRNKAQELTDKLEKAESSLRESVDKSRKQAGEQRREKEDWTKKEESLEAEIRAEVKRREKAEREAEQMLKLKEEEVLLSKERVVAVEREQRRMQLQLEEVDNLRQKINRMEEEADRAKEEYEQITHRYDLLEEDFVKTKARLVQEKELAESNLTKVKKEYNEFQFETTSLKDSYNTRQDNWIKEKLDLQERVKELNRRVERLKTVEQERRRLQDLVDEKETLLESYKKEEKYLKEERERLKKRVDDFSKSSSGVSTWTPAPDTKSSDTSNREYEGRMNIMSSEIISMQSQIASLVDERDRLRTQLTSVERNAEEARTGSLKRERARHRDEADAARRKVQELRFQLEDVREQLDDAILENKNLKLQIETDKNGFDIQMSEFKSKINQLEEQKMLESTRGQTRNIAKTRLELTWEKERGELQHLLGETQKLVGELRARLEKAEAEKEKERQGVRKQMMDMRAGTEKEHHESRRKMSELHSSLLEIRESHAKLRGLYDRMKKEREILIKEREEWRQRLQVATQLHAKISDIATDVEKVSSEVSANAGKASLPLNAEFKDTVNKVKTNLAELQKTAEALKEDERLKRSISFRRAISAQDVSTSKGGSQDPMDRWNNPQRVTNYPVAPPSMLIRPPPRQKTLHRKSLSLDHTLTGTTHEQRLKIWESEGESVTSTPAGSLLSLGGYGYETDSSMPDSEYRYGGITQNRRRYMVQTPSGMTTDSEAAYSSREGSVDPGGSSESVPLATNQQHRKTFMEKMKSLRRVKSVDVTSGRKPGEEDKREKEQSLRSKISRVLKKPLGGSLEGKAKPALPPKGLVPDVVPSRPTAEKPLSASRGELSSSSSGRKTLPYGQERRPKPPPKPGVETPV